MMIDKSAPILLVDSLASSMLIISDLLEDMGFETIETAADVDGALEILTTGGPRLVIADLHLQPTSGLQFLRTIRSNDKLKRSPFILTANSLRPAEALAIKNAGVDSFLLKPFRTEALRAKIEAAFEARPKVRIIPEPTSKRSLTAALGRRFDRSRY